MIERENVTNLDKNLDDFITTAYCHKPPRKFGQQCNREKKDDRPHDLKSQRKAPPEQACMLPQPISQPIRIHDADIVGVKDESKSRPSVVSSSQFGDSSRNYLQYSWKTWHILRVYLTD